MAGQGHLGPALLASGLTVSRRDGDQKRTEGRSRKSEVGGRKTEDRIGFLEN